MTTPLEGNENTDALKRALFALKDMRARLDAVERAKVEPIAIIGMGCHFPGANDPETYWKILSEEIDVIREVPAERWNIDDYYDSDPNAPGKMYVRKSGFIDNVDKFEPQFFGISPREVASMDPQQRILLEVTWEALEHAGILPASLAGSQTGVFVGMSTNDYTGLQVKHGDLANFDAYVGTGTSFSVAAGRIAYVLGLHGPTLTMDTACSSSLVAVHLACQNLRAGQASMAIAGGVSLILAPEGTVSMSKSHALAPDGYSKTFDAAADGYARGEGCGVIILKRLSDAIADGDNILALIKGSAINHDGRSSGLTVPNGQAQQAVIRAALEDAGGVEPQRVHFVETHGTGTQLGDPIEVRALAAALGKDRPADQPLVLGSVKANIGHLEAAAGMAGLIKVVLAFQNEKIPAQVHFKTPNPNIEWDALPVKVADQNDRWRKGERPRIAGVNAFGFSGTNAHILLEEAPAAQPKTAEVKRPQHLLTLSANDANALHDIVTHYLSYIETHPDTRLEDITFTASARRTHFSNRLAIIGNSAEQIRARLTGSTDQQSASGIVRGQSTANHKIAFLFTGQGSQYVEMGRQLYETEPVFRAALERCDELLRPYLERSLLSVIFPKDGEDTPINETAYTQPALFALEYSLAELWRSWGIVPSAVMGHSVGEYVAACVAGLFSLEDGLKLIAERGRLMQSLPHDGAMAAVFADQDTVAKAIAPYATDVSIAAINGPENIVISGLENTVQTILDTLAKDGIKASRLSVSHAFHSPLMDPILDAFEKTAASISFSKPKIAMISNVTGTAITFEEIRKPSYWRTHIRQSVQFQKAMETLRDQGHDVFLEIGPQPTLLSMGQRCIATENKLWLGSLRKGKDDSFQMLESLGTLYVNGIYADWESFHAGTAPTPIPLPTYPFQRQRFWFKEAKKSSQPRREMLHPLLGRKIRSPKLSGTLYETELGIEFPTFLNDHRIFETAIFPGTGYMEMAFAAAVQAFPGQNWSLADVAIREALLLPEEGEKTVQIAVSPVEAGKAGFEIFSLNEPDDSWKHHASGSIVLDSQGTASQRINFEQIKATCSTQIDGAGFYQQLAELGVQYGPSFQGLREIWQGEHQAFGKVMLSSADAGESHQYQLHPALLDSCFHLLGVATPSSAEQNDKVYVPVGLQALRLYQAGQSAVWAHVSLELPITKEDGTLKESLLGNLKLYSDDGSPVAEITGLQIMQVSRASILPKQQTKFEDWLYQIHWQTSERPAQDNSIEKWIIFADESGVGDRLAEELTSRGQSALLVKTGSEYQQTDGNHWRLSPLRADHFRQLFSDLKTALGDTRPGVIHLWSLDNPFDTAPQKTDELLREAQSRVAGSMLYMAQALTETNVSPARLLLVTGGVHAVRDEQVQVAAQASLWGLARTIAQEYPNWNCVAVDIESDSAEQLFTEVLAQDDENQIALRGAERFVARLERQGDAKAISVPKDQPFELVIPIPGQFDHLDLQLTERRVPGAGEVEIRVQASGLNFRDVLNALGMYPGAKIPLGIECAGVIETVGEGVTEFKVGDDVIGLTTAAFRSFATIPVERVFAKPQNITLAEAASIPTVFLTAHYGLHHLAGMKAGDRVLIHAAAGGVGLAAVQLAQRAGAEIFATAGSDEKREYLRSLGVKHIFDSRHLDFAEQIMQVTDGKGVNIILNSLADEFIPKSLSILADHGVFLEMGKRDEWDQSKVSQLNPTLKYHRYDLGTEMVNNMPFIGKMLKEMLADFESGLFKPLPLRAFPMQSVREAFRFMAQAKHIGKIVVTQVETPLIRDDATYLVTGGLGGLGLVTARWLTERGAKHIALVSRKEPTDEVCKTLDELRSQGTEIVTLQGDVARPDDTQRLFQTIEQKMPALRGVFHEAGVLDDGMLGGQTWARFENVMASKVSGAWNLHTLTQGLSLDYFVMFSSAAAVLGSAGQSNYAAANSFMDGLAYYRKTQGLPAVSINWGSWSEVGMAAALEDRNPNRRSAQEAESISPSDGMEILQKLLLQGDTQVVVLPIHWNRYKGKAVQPLLRQIVKVQAQAKDSASAGQMLERLKTLPAQEQVHTFQEYARQQVIGILGLDSSHAPQPDRALTDIGMDSLMAVELKNKIEGDLRINIPVSYFLEGTTIADLSKKLHAEYSGTNGNDRNGTDGSLDAEQAKELLSNLDQLSEDEVDSLISNLLADNEDS